MYGRRADLYDRIYDAKDYAGEVRRLRGLVRRLGPRSARDWLDVACGTGRHLAELRRDFRVVGVDRSPAMLRLARRRLPGVRLVRSDMRRLALRDRFDVVSCLFSSIGYLRTERDLRAALRAFARHLRPGGLLLVEPWLAPDELRRGHVGVNVYRDAQIAIVRFGVVRRRGDLSYLDLEYLIGIEHRGVRHVTETEVLRLTPRSRWPELLRDAGLRPLAAAPIRREHGRALVLARAPGGR